MAGVGKVFISYRREDGADAAGRIRDWLVQTWHLAKDDVFMDVTGILPGADFMQVIDQAISRCQAMIVVISPSWLAQVQAPDTPPRMEVEAALRHNLLVIPVLVNGAQVPTAAQLPSTLQPLTRRNIKAVRADSFAYDMDSVRRALGVRAGLRSSWIAAISIVLVAALGIGILSQMPEGNPVWIAFHPATPTVTATEIPTNTTVSPTFTPALPHHTFTDFTIPTAKSNPQGITAGPDGNLWFTEGFGNKIGRMTPAGTVTEFAIPSAGAIPEGIVTGPDGNLWFTEGAAAVNKIGRMTPSGTFAEFPIPSPSSFARSIVVGPDGNLWFTEEGTGKVAKITTAGVVTEYVVRSGGSFISSIAKGGDGNLWFTEGTGNFVGRITPSGIVAEFAVTCPDTITSGPDGNLWFREGCARNVIGKVTFNGVVTEYTFPGQSDPGGIAAGSDGNLWFLSQYRDADKIGQITTGGQVTEYVLSTTATFGRNITSGPDGNLWFGVGDAIGRFVP